MSWLFVPAKDYMYGLPHLKDEMSQAIYAKTTAQVTMQYFYAFYGLRNLQTKKLVPGKMQFYLLDIRVGDQQMAVDVCSH